MTREPLNQPAEIPAELDRWNWGAFLLNWIWGIGNSVFIALLMFVPLVNIVMIFVLGARGSRWAWRNRAWRDAEHFRRVQRKWAIAGVIIWLAMIGIGAALFFSILTGIKHSDAYVMTMDAVRSDAQVSEELGDDIQAGFWISGNINLNAGGTGSANFSIPITGSKGSGTALSKAVRINGVWQLRLLIVYPEGANAPLVLKNEGNVQIPGVLRSL